MAGYNHYNWCMCGWCYKAGANGYSSTYRAFDFDVSSARRKLEKHGAYRSWTAFFIEPNASCPVCSAKVFYYQNANGSRVFFDELGWPWPKHPCTNSKVQTSFSSKNAPHAVTERKRGITAELFEAAQMAAYDPNFDFKSKYSRIPFDLLKVLEVKRVGFENYMSAKSISPAMEGPVFLAFTSAKFTPSIGEYFNFIEHEMKTSFYDFDKGAYNYFKARMIAEDLFMSVKTRESD